MFVIHRMNSMRRNNNRQRIILGVFLLVGTILAMGLSAEYGYEIFYKNTIWMKREGFIGKLVFVGVFADFVLMMISGCVSLISFFSNGQLWKPITKGVIINIILWLLIIAFLFIEVILWEPLYYSMVLGLILLCVYGLWKLNKVIG